MVYGCFPCCSLQAPRSARWQIVRQNKSHDILLTRSVSSAAPGERGERIHEVFYVQCTRLCRSFKNHPYLHRSAKNRRKSRCQLQMSNFLQLTTFAPNRVCLLPSHMHICHSSFPDLLDCFQSGFLPPVHWVSLWSVTSPIWVGKLTSCKCQSQLKTKAV